MMLFFWWASEFGEVVLCYDLVFGDILGVYFSALHS